MKANAQRIAIAEACGWKRKWQNVGGHPLLDTKPQGHCWEIWFDPTGRTVDSNQNSVFPPDYLNDLNAMHEAEKILLQDSSEWDEYGLQLGRLLLGERWWQDMPCSDLAKAAHATAAQRAEAFLKTLNLWKP